jgi:uncharacterized protein (TIGR03905 family)
VTQIFHTQGTCSREIRFEVSGSVLKSVEFVGGCDGNLKAISRLVTSMQVTDVIDKLKGLPCETKSTSCPDQLACALETWVREQ